MQRELTHIPLQPWCTSSIKGKAQVEPPGRIERITEHSELPTVQRDYLILKDVVAFDGLKVLSMYAKPFGCATSTFVETKGATGTFALMSGVKVLNYFGLLDIKWVESAKSKRQERTVVQRSPTLSH